MFDYAKLQVFIWNEYKYYILTNYITIICISLVKLRLWIFLLLIYKNGVCFGSKNNINQNKTLNNLFFAKTLLPDRVQILSDIYNLYGHFIV